MPGLLVASPVVPKLRTIRTAHLKTRLPAQSTTGRPLVPRCTRHPLALLTFKLKFNRSLIYSLLADSTSPAAAASAFQFALINLIFNTIYLN